MHQCIVFALHIQTLPASSSHENVFIGTNTKLYELFFTLQALSLFQQVQRLQQLQQLQQSEALLQ